jgi:hypothetical protein
MDALTKYRANRRRQQREAEHCIVCGVWLEVEDRRKDENGETVCESCQNNDEEDE